MTHCDHCGHPSDFFVGQKVHMLTTERSKAIDKIMDGNFGWVEENLSGKVVEILKWAHDFTYGDERMAIVELENGETVGVWARHMRTLPDVKP